MIDVAIPADRNVVQKEAEKKLKHKKNMHTDRRGKYPQTEMLCKRKRKSS